jgi:hypothetical protein
MFRAFIPQNVSSPAGGGTFYVSPPTWSGR